MRIQWKSMPSPGKGKAKKNPARATRVARKEKKATQAKVTEKRQQNTHDSKVHVETVESTDTMHLIVGTSRRTNLKAKARAREKSKSKVTEISESDSSKQVDETWTPNTSAQQPHLSQVNTIGCADEGLWIFSLEDSRKRQHTVKWEDQSDCNQTEEHELMIISGCFGHVCPPWFAPQFPMVSSTNVEAVADGHVMKNSGKRILIQITFDVMNVRKPLLSTSALKHRGVTIIFNDDFDRIIFRNETVNLVSHDCHSYLHVTLTNGIPPRRALVMAGENATMKWMKKSTATMAPRDIDEQSPMRIKRDSLISLVKRKLQEYDVLLNHRQMLREWHTTRHTFHSEIGARSVLRVVDEVLRTDELW